MRNYQLYINGQWVDAQSGRTYAIRNPATGEIISNGAYGDEVDSALAVDAAHQAFKEWSLTPATERAEILRKLYWLMLDNAEELARTITLEMGKPIREARSEVKLAAEYLLWNAEEGRRVCGQTIPSSSRDKRLQVIRQPVGPVAAITPWNFPISMVTRKVAPALAAGCTVVFKPASQAPGSAIQFFQLAEQAGLPSGVINLVTGNSSSIGKQLLTDERIRKATFTGSTEIGKDLMQLAAGQVKRLSLELGGHAPFLVFADANIEQAVEAATASKFRNNGQTCVCTNRIYIEESIKERFLTMFKAKVESLRIGDGIQDEVDLGPLVNQASLESVHAQVEDAIQKGATVVTGGKHLRIAGLEDGCFYAPTILDQVNEDMLISYEETFGPIAPIYSFHNEDEVIARANDTVYGLAAYVFTNDLSRATRVSEALEYGMIGVNDAMITTVQGPFGGIKESGMGREGGTDGLADFLETKFISTVIQV